MTETVIDKIPEQGAFQQEAQAASIQALSRTALEGLGVAAQHYYGANGHFMGKTFDGEHRLIVNLQDEGGHATNEAVGNGEDTEAALHDSLTQMRTLETVRTKPITYIEMNESASVYFTTLAHYNPRVAPSRNAYPVPSYLEGVMTDSEHGDATYANTVKQEGWQTEVRSVLEGYLTSDSAGKELLDTLKISSLDHLTPEQAVKLSAAFVQNVSKYSQADLGVKGATRADNATAIELLKEGISKKDDPTWEGNGVCRNIASSVKAVFESLKATQGELSMLNNTYVVFDGGADGAGYRDKREDSFSTSLDATGHAWNTFITIDAEGSAIATIIDATWALGRDANSAVQHLDRTEQRAAAPMVQLFEQSTTKPQAFEGLSYYLAQLVNRSATNSRLSQAQRDDIREYATTQYLRAAAQLPETPEGHTLPDTFMSAAYRMRGQLEKEEVATLFALDKAGGSLERDRLGRLIKGYDSDRKVSLPGWKMAENLVFKDDELQELAYEAVGKERTLQLAESDGGFRMRLRQQHPELLPAFDPYNQSADAQELAHIASQSGINERDPKTILRTMNRTLKNAAGDPAIYDAIVAGRSDYDLAQNFRAITTALRKKQANQ